MWQYGWMSGKEIFMDGKTNEPNPPFATLFDSSAERKGGRQRGAYLAVLTDYGWKVVWVGEWELGLGLELYQDTRLLWHITTVIRRS
jgi:hypothetical protein